MTWGLLGPCSSLKSMMGSFRFWLDTFGSWSSLRLGRSKVGSMYLFGSLFIPFSYKRFTPFWYWSLSPFSVVVNTAVVGDMRYIPKPNLEIKEAPLRKIMLKRLYCVFGSRWLWEEDVYTLEFEMRVSKRENWKEKSCVIDITTSIFFQKAEW